MNHLKDEDGSILVSTVALLLFLSFLITTVSVILTNQVNQLNQMSMAYETKAMLQMTSRLVEDEWDKGFLQSGQLTFSKGTVLVDRQTPESVIIRVNHESGQTRTETIYLKGEK